MKPTKLLTGIALLALMAAGNLPALAASTAAGSGVTIYNPLPPEPIALLAYSDPEGGTTPPNWPVTAPPPPSDVSTKSITWNAGVSCPTGGGGCTVTGGIGGTFKVAAPEIPQMPGEPGPTDPFPPTLLTMAIVSPAPDHGFPRPWGPTSPGQY